MSHFRPLRMIKNAVGTKSISTSGPELWGFEFLGVRPPYTFHKHCSGKTNMPFGTYGWRASFAKI